MGNDNSLVTLVITYISFYSIQKLDCSLSIYLSIILLATFASFVSWDCCYRHTLSRGILLVQAFTAVVQCCERHKNVCAQRSKYYDQRMLKNQLREKNRCAPLVPGVSPPSTWISFKIGRLYDIELRLFCCVKSLFYQ
jgi:hypothetical protein